MIPPVQLNISRHLQLIKNFIDPGSHAGDIIKMVNVIGSFCFYFWLFYYISLLLKLFTITLYDLNIVIFFEKEIV